MDDIYDLPPEFPEDEMYEEYLARLLEGTWGIEDPVVEENKEDESWEDPWDTDDEEDEWF